MKKKTKTAILSSILFLLWAFAGIIIGQTIIGSIFVVIFGRDFWDNALLTTIFTATSYALSCFLILYLPGKFKKLKLATSREELGLAGLPKWRDIPLAVLGFVAYFILGALLVALFTWIFPDFNAAEAQQIGYTFLPDTPSRILGFIGLVIIAPIAEELIFRGWLYGKLRRYTPIYLALLLVSALFAAAHGAINVAVNVFALSTVMCLLRELTGTIYAPIILHMLKNAIAFYALIYLGVL